MDHDLNRPHRVGLLVGRERSFPEALIAEVARRGQEVVVEYAEISAPRAHQVPPYDVLVDRISHEVTCYQPFLKLAQLHGTHVINPTSQRIADDKFYNAAVARKLGVLVPKTVLLPSKSYGSDVNDESLTNLRLVDWQGLAAELGFPMFMKPHWGGGWRDVTRCKSMEELHAAFDRSGALTMIVQEEIRWRQYVRCIVIGTNVQPALWDPRLTHFERYARAHETMPPLGSELTARVVREAELISRTLGYQMNTVEFAITESGEPYAIDYMNSAPDLDITSLGEQHFGWAIGRMADLVIAEAKKAPERRARAKAAVA